MSEICICVRVGVGFRDGVGARAAAPFRPQLEHFSTRCGNGRHVLSKRGLINSCGRVVLLVQRAVRFEVVHHNSDAGAFGKGLALDRLWAADFGSGGRWLADLGGQVAVGPASRGGRQVALAHPVERDRAVVEVRLEHGSLAVSGGSERDRHVNHVPVGHILDPRTGRPVSREFSVVVWHTRALVADILATALYVMGADEGLAWAEARGLVACFLLPVTAEKSSTALDGVELSATVAFTRRFL